MNDLVKHLKLCSFIETSPIKLVNGGGARGNGRINNRVIVLMLLYKYNCPSVHLSVCIVFEETLFSRLLFKINVSNFW